MRTTMWRTTGAALLAGAALLIGACAPAPESVDAPAPKPVLTKPTTTTTEPGAVPSTSFAAATTQASIGDCEVFPPDHFLNATNIDRLPVHQRSAAWIAHLEQGGAKLGVPSSSIWEGARGGMPLNVVDSRTTGLSQVHLNGNYIGLSLQHTGGYPIPANPRVEGYPSAQWDQHLLMVDVADCTAYELIGYNPLTYTLFRRYAALAGVRYSLASNERPALTTNSAGTPMIGQYALADEVTSGALAHVLGFCNNAISPTHTWPARASDGTSTSPDAPPMGAWLRLRGDVDLSRFTGQALTIAKALRKHGMVLTDTCAGKFGLFGENSDNWNAAQMNQLRSLSPRNFEAVDTTTLKRSATSFAIR